MFIYFKMEDDSDVCSKHMTRYLKCKFQNCSSLKICKICSTESKEDLKHLYEHFDNIETIEDDLSKYKDKIKIVEEFVELNKVFVSQLVMAHGFTENTLQGLINSRALISGELRKAFFEKYTGISTSFEEFVKSFNEKLGNLKTSNKNILKEIRVMKDQLEEKTKFLTNQDLLKKEFEEITKLAEKKLMSAQVKDLLGNKIKFNLSKKGDVYWKDTNSNMITTTTHTGSYWCVKSDIVLTGTFEAKVTIIKIDSSKVNDDWNYGFGIIRAINSDDNTYYNDSVFFKSNGIQTKLSGSNDIKVFSDLWKDGDILMVKET